MAGTVSRQPSSAVPLRATLTSGQPRRHVRPSVQLERYRAEIRAIVARHRGANVRVFGSVLHGTDTEASDLDLLVDQAPGQRMTLFDLSAIFCEIEDLLQIPVDVQTTGGCPPRSARGSNEKHSRYEGVGSGRLRLSHP